MTEFDIHTSTIGELFVTYGAVLDELERRNVVRSANNPLCDYAERLFCDAFGWTQESNSAAGYDAKDKHGLRYQVKGRRLTTPKSSRQVSALRRLDSDLFDFLAGVLVDRRFEILRAAIIPCAVVRNKATYQQHTNSWIFYLKDDVWNENDVRDVTANLRTAAMAM